ncbi:hypothetical protein Q4561_17440 [Alteromonas sp. 1_MG-2023]|uniref:hypothetical protein n=1 Tax=Alteromonas sp. 1_MG-2023 TaxID=3062669 RepID=UPI0026E21DAD|nr:hypothetical protein [Alteromonas sp. 1_MG-2023]MDO6568860.1 hypothetical protein [Alteromonas sp. 1_MG-2023]
MNLVIKHSKEIIFTIFVGVIIAIVSTLILDFIYAETGPDETAIVSQTNPQNKSVPQLWSHHKLLEVNADECANKALSILKTLDFQSVVKNERYVYGNLNGNRATIKCAEVANHSFVYTAVAGANVASVEKLRNEIAWKL